MYTEQQIRDMSAREFLTVLDAMTRTDLASLLTYLWGYDPRALAAALNHNPRVTCGKVYVAADDGEVRACQRQSHDAGGHWVYDEDNNMAHRSAPPTVSGDYFFSSPDDSTVAEEVAES